MERGGHRGDVAEEVARLKAETGTAPSAGIRNRRARPDTAAARLLDELHLWIFPVLGVIRQPLIDGIEITLLRLVETTPFASGIVVNTYAPTR